MTDLTVSQIEEIKEEQKAYFNEIIETDKEGNDVSRSEYEQVKRGVNEGYYIDIYDGPNGKGYVIIEERTVNGQLQNKMTGYGAEGRNRKWFDVNNTM